MASGSARLDIPPVKRHSPDNSYMRKRDHAMKYKRLDAKDYARENMTGIWAAALNPFNPDYSMNEEGLRANLRHWTGDLSIDGVFIAGNGGAQPTPIRTTGESEGEPADVGLQLSGVAIQVVGLPEADLDFPFR